MTTETEAFLEITETTTVGSLWFAPWDTGDLLAVSSKPADDQPWGLLVRVRYRVDDEPNPLKSEDRKTGWRVTTRAADDAARERINTSADALIPDLLELAGVPKAPITRVDINGGPATFARIWATLPFANTGIISAGPERPQ